MQVAMKSAVASRPMAASRRSSVAVRAARPMWYPGATAPAHLDGKMAGDYGFDPLRLGVNADNLKWFREAELYNGRVAMMAVVGILFTDAVGLPKFWLAGAEKYAIDNNALVAIEAAVFAVLEGKRWDNYRKTGSTGFLGWSTFDPMGMMTDETRVKEIKNGRLAMLAFVGFCSQAAIYGKGPIECLQNHLENPYKNNIYSTSVGPETCVTVALLCFWPLIIEASKSLNPKESSSKPLFPWNEPWSV